MNDGSVTSTIPPLSGGNTGFEGRCELLFGLCRVSSDICTYYSCCDGFMLSADMALSMTTASNPHGGPMKQDLLSPDFGF